jgi:ADP-ribosyl-[dinitrogen reductase] hydrolase
MAAFKFDALELPHGRARIALCPCPGQSGQLAKDLQRLRDWGAMDLVTLIEDHELALLGVTSMAIQVEATGMRWWHLPIRDMGTPDAGFETRWQAAGDELGKVLESGCSIAVHCRGGMGRTGTVAARLLVELGMAPAQAIEHVRAARPGSIETKEQELFVLECG